MLSTWSKTSSGRVPLFRELSAQHFKGKSPHHAASWMRLLRQPTTAGYAMAYHRCYPIAAVRPPGCQTHRCSAAFSADVSAQTIPLNTSTAAFDLLTTKRSNLLTRSAQAAHGSQTRTSRPRARRASVSRWRRVRLKMCTSALCPTKTSNSTSSHALVPSRWGWASSPSTTSPRRASTCTAATFAPTRIRSRWGAVATAPTCATRRSSGMLSLRGSGIRS